MEEANLDILCIGAHPDDVEMTSGGLMALAASQGRKVGALHLSKGEMGTRGTPQTREVEANDAAKVLGLSGVYFAGLMDGHIWCDETSVQVVTEFLRRLRPKLVVTHYPQCHHPDHEQASLIVRRAVHFAGKRRYECEASPHNVQALIYARYSHPFAPSFYVDISSVVDAKRDAIACYGSQFRAESGEPMTRLSNPSFTDQLLARGFSNGLTAGVLHAEEYVSAGPLVTKDPLSLFAGQSPLPTLLR